MYGSTVMLAVPELGSSHPCHGCATIYQVSTREGRIIDMPSGKEHHILQPVGEIADPLDALPPSYFQRIERRLHAEHP